MTECVLRKRIL